MYCISIAPTFFHIAYKSDTSVFVICVSEDFPSPPVDLTQRERLSFKCEGNHLLDSCHVNECPYWNISHFFLFWGNLNILDLT